MLFTELMANVYGNLFAALATILPNFLAETAATTSTGDGLKFLGAGVAGIGVFGAGIGQGAVGQGACMAIGRNPEMASKITSTMIIAAGIAESGAIYALVIAILLVFVA
ncbi:F0F1 ATP synthase subunit C [Williamsoniiplasma somnilux]|uniref:ATP synthase subunit c n=1 Tax=Williamsoniiplasma somnilux TaxID=215578 RepID=A0A2K8NZ30_9MOLU|nr:ATP synthase subunit C [Williamsoniiplasma somnilux]ATZ19047.1 F0F1 ATP synthase subunit C [Williamsoniiplasma somnilux]